jgi:hypothetical protein
MVVQGSFNFSPDVFAQALVSDHHHGFELVAKATQISELTVTERHNGFLMA